MTRFCILSLSAMMMFVPLIGANDAELVDNPAYHAWDDAPIGTVVHVVGTAESGETIGKLRGSRKLIERTPDALTFELTATKTDHTGKVSSSPVRQQIVKSRVPPERANVPEEMEGSAKFVREETITVADKSYKCTVVQIEGTYLITGSEVTVTRWNCDEVIGQTVRSISEFHQEKVTTKLELDSIEVP